MMKYQLAKVKDEEGGKTISPHKRKAESSLEQNTSELDGFANERDVLSQLDVT
jgi:hypothetical protein